MGYIFLSLAILAEIVATSSLKYTEQFSRLGPSLIVVIGYASAFYFLSLSLKELNLGIAYAIWCGAGIIGIALIQHFLYRNTLDLAGIVGILFIVSGGLTIHLFSNTISGE